MLRATAARVAVLLVSVLATVGVCEISVRALGYQPWTAEERDRYEPIMHEPDPVLGWRNKEGHYSVPPYTPDGRAIQVTFLETGQRRTASDPLPATVGDLILVGDSFTEGWAVDDTETYAWKLQDQAPALRVLNYGTAGYSGYQSLLQLKQILPRSRMPRLVVYGFNEFQEDRNVATAVWLEAVERFTRRGHASVPFATIDDRRLVRHAPERYISLPFRQSLSIVPLLERGMMRLKTHRRSSQKQQVTEEIMRQMNTLAAEHGASFVVAMLSLPPEPKRHYVSYLKANHIPTFDCVYEITEDMKVPGEGHPNAAMHSRWAACLAASLAAFVDNWPEPGPSPQGPP